MSRLRGEIVMSEPDLYSGTRLDAIEILEARLAQLRRRMLVEVIAHLSYIDDPDEARSMARAVVWR